MGLTSLREENLKKRLEQHGYKLEKITHFQKFDRIHFGNRNIKINLKLKGKLSQFALDALVEACVGSGDAFGGKTQ